ncbi:MAG: hypothetical protein MJ247_07750 [Alphaproteobacteria bacterium]|nr:hypothetical protein [Alphaproteobacteria bacterium]
MFESIKQLYAGTTQSVTELKENVSELVDFFNSVKGAVMYLFELLGQETTLLLFFTFVLLLVLNMIPFLFLSKKRKYYFGILFGIFIGYKINYSILSITKYVIIMIAPLFVDYLVAYIFKKTMRILFGGLWKGIKLGSLFTLNQIKGDHKVIANKEDEIKEAQKSEENK